MLQLTAQSYGSQPPANQWQVDTIVRAVDLLGWRGVLRGPVSFGGVEFIAVCSDRPFGAPGSGWLVGSLVPDEDPFAAMRQAGLLAAYSARAILVRSFFDPVELQLQTALLDQGAVVAPGSRNPYVVSTAGGVVPSDLQDDEIWPTDRRWNALWLTVSMSGVLGETG